MKIFLDAVSPKWNNPLQHQCYGKVVEPPRRGIKWNVWEREPDRKPQSASPPLQLKPGLFCLFRGRGRDSIDRRALESELTKCQKQTQYSCAHARSRTRTQLWREPLFKQSRHTMTSPRCHTGVCGEPRLEERRDRVKQYDFSEAPEESANSPFKSIRALFRRVYVQRVIYMVRIF